MRRVLRCAILAVSLRASLADDDDDDDAPKKAYVDVNPTLPRNLLSACPAGSYGTAATVGTCAPSVAAQCIASNSADCATGVTDEATCNAATDCAWTAIDCGLWTVFTEPDQSTCEATTGCVYTTGDAAEACTDCDDGRTTEVWSLQEAGALGCATPGDDEDGEDSDDWVPSLAACKSTCTGTCPGIVWTNPAGPTSCLKCSPAGHSAAGRATRATNAATTEVHLRVAAGASLKRQCDFCTNGRTLITRHGQRRCAKTGLCTTIGPVPYYKVSGNCRPCPAQEDVGTGLQGVLMLVLLGGGFVFIWFTSGAPDVVGDVGDTIVASRENEDVDVGTAISSGAGPMVEAMTILLPTFQFVAAVFSFDFGWPSLIRDLGVWLKTLFQGNFSEVATPECLFSYGAYAEDDKYYAVIFLKFGIFVAFAVVFGIVAATGSKRAVACVATAYKVMLVLLASACFKAIDVVEVEHGPSAGEYALKTLPSITSETDDFGSMLAVGIFGLFVFLIVIPGVFLVLIYSANKQYDGPNGALGNKLWGPDFIAAFGSLYTAYRPGCWWYEFVIMARKITLVGIAIMCENAAVMFMSSTAVLGGSLAVNLLLKPYHQGGHVVEERDLNAGAEEEKEDEEFMERGEELVYLHAEDTKEGRTTADKVEALCLATLIGAYSLGALSLFLTEQNLAEQNLEDGSGAGTLIIILAVLVLLVPIAGTVALYKTAPDDGDAVSGAIPDLESTEMDISETE